MIQNRWEEKSRRKKPALYLTKETIIAPFYDELFGLPLGQKKSLKNLKKKKELKKNELIMKTMSLPALPIERFQVDL